MHVHACTHASGTTHLLVQGSAPPTEPVAACLPGCGLHAPSRTRTCMIDTSSTPARAPMAVCSNGVTVLMVASPAAGGGGPA